MLRLKCLILPAVLLLQCYGGALDAEAAEPVSPKDSLVITLSQTPGAVLAGNGFVIGDGSLVVTNYHLVFETSRKGEHRMAGSVVVISPYLGDAREAEIVAADKVLDVVVLRVPWKGHPALKLADDKDVLLADRVRVITMHDMIRAAGPETSEPLRKFMSVQTQNCPVEFVAVRKRVPIFLKLTGAERMGVGWSGSPVLLAEAPEVAGLITKLTLKSRTDRHVLAAKATAAAQVRRLVLDAGLKTSLKRSRRSLARPEDATDAFLACMQSMRGILTSKHFQSAFDNAQDFIRLRPECVFGHRLVAFAAEGLDKHELAVTMYRKALALDPEGSAVQKPFALRLAAHGQYDEAVALLETAWKSGKDRDSCRSRIWG